MTLITGQVSDVGMNNASGVFYARAAEFRGDGTTVVAPLPTAFTITGGVVSAEVAPGPTIITLHVGPARKEWFVNVPEADVGLGDLIATYTEYEPAVVSAAIKARDAAIEAESEAKQAAIDAEAKRASAEAAASLTGADRLHVDNVRALLDETYDESQAGMALPPRLTETALNATYGAKATTIQELLALLPSQRVVILPPGGDLTTTTRVSIPAGTTVYANGCTIRAGTGYAGDYVVSLEGETRVIGTLNVAANGVANARGVAVTGDNIQIDTLAVSAGAAGAGSADKCDGVRIGVRRGQAADPATRHHNITITTLNVTNFDRAVACWQIHDLTIGRLRVDTYQTGIYLADCRNATVSGRIYGASPNAQFLPGNNGVLVESLFTDFAASNIRLRVDVSDAGEHGFRLGGQRRISHVQHDGCSATNVGGCGFKALGGSDGTSFHENINWDNCVVEDAGQTTNNQSGFLVERVQGGKINSPTVRKRGKAFSAWKGVRIVNCADVHTLNPDIRDTASDGYEVTGHALGGGVLGACENVILTAGAIRRPGGAGILLDYSGVAFRRVNVTSRPLIEMPVGSTSAGVLVKGDSYGLTGGSFPGWSTSGPSLSVEHTGNAVPLAGDTNFYMVDIVANFPTASPPTARPGSIWLDRGAGVLRIRSGSAWSTAAAAA